MYVIIFPHSLFLLWYVSFLVFVHRSQTVVYEVFYSIFGKRKLLYFLLLTAVSKQLYFNAKTKYIQNSVSNANALCFTDLIIHIIF